MKAMVLQAVGSPLVEMELPDPQPGPGQLLLEVGACAVCRTDLHVYDGDLTEPSLPLILGHEIVGTVIATGDGVERYSKGDRVGVPWLGWTCGVCDFCRSGRENLCNKASGALAMKWLFHREGMTPDKVDFIISCGEEACGDRYQRSGGGMAKAIGEMCGCVNASGIDIKNFCAAPSSAIITAASMVKAGLYENIVVVGGGSLAKLGMKYKAFVGNDMPILDDCLSSIAILISKDDGKSPVIQMESGTVGKAAIGSSTSDEKVYKDIILKPLKALGLKMTDIDRYAPELQNPEIMEFAGSGDVAKKNYRKIAAMAAISKQLEKKEMNSFIEKIGMPGFAPTQGHIPSAVPYLAHALEEVKAGKITRAMFVGKASLFLGRHTSVYDGVSFILKRNHNAK